MSRHTPWREIRHKSRRRKNKPKGVSYTAPKKKINNLPTPKQANVRFKWSYNDKNDELQIWPTNEYGTPSHTQQTGSRYYEYDQGRLYVFGEGPRNTIGPDEDVQIMVWKDRGSPEGQKKAVEAVKQWVLEHFGVTVDKVNYRVEFPATYYGTGSADHGYTDYGDDLKDTDRDYLAEQYAIAVDKDGKDPEDAYSDFNKPIDWDKAPAVAPQYWMWYWDGTDFNARRADTATVTSPDYEEKFGDDGTWSSQGMVAVQGNHVTLIIDSKKPYAFHNDPLELTKEQNDAKDAGIKWIKTILGLNIDHVKYAYKIK